MVDAFIQLQAIQREFDNAAADLEKTVGTSVCINCGHCCSVNTPSWMTIEALNAVSVYAGRPVFRQAVSVAEGWLLDKQGFRVMEGIPIGFPKAELAEEWHKVQASPCPFMAQKRCLIYEARPLACRAYGVTRKADHLSCRRRPGKGETLTQRRWIVDENLRRVVTLYKKITAEKNPAWIEYGQVPTFFFRAADEPRFRGFTKDNRIASAKLCGTGDIDTTILWQPQMDALNTGASPDLVAAGRY